jgi:riboflavin kinase/FMN adenylyltransferase
MGLFQSLDEIQLDTSWLTIGMYDGIHLGHQSIVRTLVDGAHAASHPAVLVTFDPHPAAVLRPDFRPQLLTTPGERAALLAGLGLDHTVIQHFDREFSLQTAEEYVRHLKDRTGFDRLLVGYDFAMGRDRGGDVAALRRMGPDYGYELQVFEPVMHGDAAVSSSRIRKALAAGQVRDAAALLGRSYAVSGPIVEGARRGRSIGIPTANVAVPAEKVIPAAGVYACRVTVDGAVYGAATNIGVRPTFEPDAAAMTVEAHLLDFDGDIYNEVLEVAFVERLREEIKFPGVEALVAQIRADILTAREVLDADIS